MVTADVSRSETQADAGLLVIHGVGAHAPGSTLDAIVDPLLARLNEERQLVNVSTLRVGDGAGIWGEQHALLIRYTTLPVPPATPEANERRLLAVEGNWSDVFQKAGADRISAWVGRHTPRMMLELFFYHARGLMCLWSLLTVALLAAAIITSRDPDPWRPLALFAAGLAVALGVVLTVDLRDVMRTPHDPEGWLSVGAVAASLIIYQVQRGLVLIVTFAGIFILPVAAATLRWLSSLPLLSGLANGLLRGVEAALLTGGIADMEAVAEDHVTAAVIRTRLRDALLALEQRVKPGGTITVVAHSGGAPPAWRLLSEPEIVERQCDPRFRYRLLTVGAALNWARRGFADRATPLDGPLVNHDRPPEERTLWLNVYATWDPVPHGPAPATEFFGWDTWERDPPRPNRLVRNLGAPVPAEHGEYWQNQQEFLPMLVRAIDPDVQWAQRDAGPDEPLWSNCRLALLSALVRARLAIVALPVAALLAMLRGLRFIACPDDEPGTRLYRSAFTDAVGAALKALLTRALGEEGFVAVRDRLCDWPILAGALILAALAAVAYTLLDVYTNYLWQSLGRRVVTLRPISDPPPRFAVPLRAALVVWLPTLVLLPLLLWPFHLGRVAWLAITATNTLLAFSEVFWLNTCLRAFRTDALRAVCAAPIGRQQPAAQTRTPAGKSALPP